MRLRTLLFGVVVIVGLVLAGTVYTGYQLHKEDVTEQESQRLEIEAESVAKDLDNRLEDKRTTITLWSETPGVGRHDTPAQRRALETLVEHTSFDGASVVAANGTMVALVSTNLSDERRRQIEGRDFADRTYVQRALAGAVYISQPFQADSGNYIVTISAPIRRNGTVVGTLNGAFHLTSQSFFNSSRTLLEPEQSMAVVAGNETLYGEPLTSETLLRRQSTIPSTGWTVTVAEPRATAMQQLRRASAIQSGALVVTVGAIGFLGIWLSRTTVQKVDRLLAGLQRLAAREYDARLDLGGIDEWRRIGDEFDSLARTLQQRDSQLRVLNRVLRHNLRNDINVVMGHANSLLDRDGLDDDVRSELRQIRVTASKLIHTSEHAQTLYEQVAGDGEISTEPVNVVTVIEDQIQDLEATFADADIETELPDTAWARSRSWSRNSFGTRSSTTTTRTSPSPFGLTTTPKRPRLPSQTTVVASRPLSKPYWRRRSRSRRPTTATGSASGSSTGSSTTPTAPSR
ncbi:cache domain-containing protein [Haloarculaceae archaeon H-GB2-1]|nr:cache domain-containing protein [Haloarculaceae archaeon H-GB1-1]MEA5407586.1 cache domain-containing protein [Haloarculaceae archaeon H-GB2-1]